MLRRISGSVSSSAGTCVVAYQRRGVRQQIPPRPNVFALCYFDHRGLIVEDNRETDIAIIRTRDLKFYLQRIMPNGEVIRWPAPGCDPMRNATSFEQFSLTDIDTYGGVIIPQDVAPTNPYEPPSIIDAVMLMANLEVTKKVTRQVRRGWHRRVYADKYEDPLKYQMNMVGNSLLVLGFALFIGTRWLYCRRHGIGFFDLVSGATVERKTESIWDRANRYGEEHIEQVRPETIVSQLSPGQKDYSRMRAEMRESDFTDPHFKSEMYWKLRHLVYYGHWPKGLAE